MSTILPISPKEIIWEAHLKSAACLCLKDISLSMLKTFLMLRHRTNNSCICVIPEIKILSFLRHTISENSILIAQDQFITKETAHHRTPLPLLVLLLTDGADQTIFHTPYCHPKVHWLATELLIINAKVAMYLEH